MSDYITALLFLCVGVFFKYHASFLDQGTMSGMGPGYYPDLVATALIVIAVLIALKRLIWKS